MWRDTCTTLHSVGLVVDIYSKVDPKYSVSVRVRKRKRERVRLREREREREKERERERSVYHMSQTILRHDSQDESVSRRRSGAEVHGNNSRK